MEQLLSPPSWLFAPPGRLWGVAGDSPSAVRAATLDLWRALRSAAGEGRPYVVLAPADEVEDALEAVRAHDPGAGRAVPLPRWWQVADPAAWRPDDAPDGAWVLALGLPPGWLPTFQAWRGDRPAVIGFTRRNPPVGALPWVLTVSSWLQAAEAAPGSPAPGGGQRLPKARAVRFADGQIVFDLTNGGELRFPLGHFPRLAAAAPAERAAWRIVWDGEAVRWDALDEDISLRLLLTGEC